ncbi:glycosyltransferase [bacterium]|nr:glycosyltransferase [bacterium]
MLSRIQQWFTVLYGVLSGFMVLGLYLVKRRYPPSRRDDFPSIAVCVAARNEEKNLPFLLESLSRQEYPVDRIQFFIVDDSSEDETERIIREWEQKDERFHYVEPDTNSSIASPKKRALDTAIRMADAQWIVTTDADCRPGPRWLLSMANYMGPETVAVVGYSPLHGARNLPGLLLMGESWSSAALAAAGIGLGFPFNCFGRNFAFRRTQFIDLGGYGTDGKVASGDDDLLLQRLSMRTDMRIRFADHPDSFVPSYIDDSHNALNTKARHMSVGLRYAPGWILIGLIGNLLFMGLALLTLLIPFLPSEQRRIKRLWKTKWVLDSFMALSAVNLLGSPWRGVLAMITMTVAPFAFWIIWPRALFMPIQWKGRTFAKGNRAG